MMNRDQHRPSLTALANQYGSDKGTIGPSDHWQGLNYTDVYSAYFETIRDQPIRLLEIGIGATGDRWDARIVHGRNKGGASIRMWADYFPNAKITAIDINPASYLNTDQISTYVVDQSSEKQLMEFAESQPDFDVIIDDGSHNPAHQQLSLSILFPKLKTKGIYIIEDLDDNGKGDPCKDERTYNNEVFNTRSVLQSFASTRKPKDPHAFQSVEFLDQVDQISFHCPEVSTTTQWQLFPPRKRTNFKFLEGTERLCVLRKA